QFGSRFYANDATPGFLLKHPETMGEEAHKQFLADWKKFHQGGAHAHEMAILEEGMDVVQLGMKPKDAETLASRKFQITEVARWLDLPPHMLGDLEKSSFNNIEEQGLEFVIFALTQWFVMWEQGLERDLLPLENAGAVFVKFIEKALLRGNIKNRNEALNTQLMNGTISINEARALDDLNPIENGDLHFVPLNMIPIDQAAEGISAGDNPPDDPDNDEEGEGRVRASERELRVILMRIRLGTAHLSIFFDGAARVLHREATAMERAAKRADEVDRKSWNAWADTFYSTFPETIIRTMLPVFIAYAETVRGAAQEECGMSDNSAGLEEFVRKYAEAFAVRHIARSRDDVARCEGFPCRSEGWQERRIAGIAGPETHRLGNAVAEFVYQNAGVRKRWRVVSCASAACKNRDGQTRDADGTFCDCIGHPPIDDMPCDCLIVAAP
ncbi:hypothetical protein LCGC14_2615890, partial [marine sediment metagenome]